MAMEFKTLKISRVERVSQAIVLVEFTSTEELPGLTPPVHIYVYKDDDVYRPYSPVFTDRHTIKLAVKVYKDGVVSKYISNMRPGSWVRVKLYHSNHDFPVNKYGKVLMIAGGTGITPIYQILNYALNREDNETRFTLLHLNTYEDEDILKYVKLPESKHLEKISVLTGEMSDEVRMREERVIDVVDKDQYDFVYVCGPPSLMEFVSGPKTITLEQGEVTGLLREKGYTSDKVWKL